MFLHFEATREGVGQGERETEEDERTRGEVRNKGEERRRPPRREQRRNEKGEKDYLYYAGVLYYSLKVVVLASLKGCKQVRC